VVCPLLLLVVLFAEVFVPGVKVWLTLLLGLDVVDLEFEANVLLLDTVLLEAVLLEVLLPDKAIVCPSFKGSLLSS
jgi:hypothetical protein